MILSRKNEHIYKTYLILAGIIILACTLTDILPKGMIGALGIMVVVGYILNEIGNKTPIIKFLGGGPIIVIFGSAYLFHTDVVSHQTAEMIAKFTKEGGFLNFYIASLITGAILGMDRKVLKKAAPKYLPMILVAVFMAFLLAALVGTLLGGDLFEDIMFIALPIMGGGMGAGAVPMVEIMHANTGMSEQVLMSKMVPALTIGNALSLMMAGLLNTLGKQYPNLTGNGQLLRKMTKNHSQDKIRKKEKALPPVTIKSLAIGAFLAIAMYFVGKLLSSFIALHTYALMILFVALVKVTGMMPQKMEKMANSWYRFTTQNLTPALLVGIGVAYINLKQIIASLDCFYFLVVFSIVIGAVIGAALAGQLMGFYPIESAITGGLCMADMGGTGDVAVCAASERMELMPFAQISSRIGGAFMLILASLIIEMIT